MVILVHFGHPFRRSLPPVFCTYTAPQKCQQCIPCGIVDDLVIIIEADELESIFASRKNAPATKSCKDGCRCGGELSHQPYGEWWFSLRRSYAIAMKDTIWILRLPEREEQESDCFDDEKT